jgi:hypothetical protein
MHVNVTDVTYKLCYCLDEKLAPVFVGLEVLSWRHRFLQQKHFQTGFRFYNWLLLSYFTYLAIASFFIYSLA